MTLSKVVWNDAWVSHETHTESDISHEPIVVTTYGVILRDDEKGVSIANEIVGDSGYRGVTFILRPLIISVTAVRAPRKAKKVEKPVEEEVQ